ncbi:XRE family transcriptional regulator [Apilactobacillus micheneri]|uniref:XRE family transcriptional regulator n=1 Tax=Apilactobacillus micheneri TaxID=1899430 RepID=A0ABY2YX38_9LACO|nr:XRE family transcriptional regulator [Apilactobacillus micheneri]TPR24456.1 XRE family transcriptional regulator [Apilactobacillus micheneri]TPR29403.1 XRE family transcriptional regulator [Apilactobacillus micheneri]TPR34610.1 XRE family transcriptional regulator [Apilactobacillus micheneri]
MFSKNLKYLRKKQGVDQIDIANAIGRKSTASISAWEKGQYAPKLLVLSKIAHYFNTSIDDLMETDLSKQMPQYPLKDESSDNLVKMYEALNVEDKKHAISYIKFLHCKNRQQLDNN